MAWSAAASWSGTFIWPAEPLWRTALADHDLAGVPERVQRGVSADEVPPAALFVPA